MTEPTTCCFPAPWAAVELHEAFWIKNTNGLVVAYVHFTDDPERRVVTDCMSKDEARRIAHLGGAYSLDSQDWD